MRYDHTILIGDLEAGRDRATASRSYTRGRRMDWLMQPMMD